MQHFDSNLRLVGSAVTVSTFASGWFSRIQIALSTSGWMTVGWNNDQKDGTAEHDEGVYAQVFDPSGNKAGPEFPLHPILSGDQYLDDLVMDSDADLYAMWSGSGSYARRSTSMSAGVCDAGVFHHR